MSLQSPKIIGLIFLILIIFLSIDFYQKKEEDLWQFNYAWDQEKTIEEVKIDSILKMGYDYVEIAISKKISTKFKKNNTLKFITGKKDYYFLFNSYQQSTNKIRFSSGFWLLDQPNNIKYPRLQLVNLPLKQNGDIKVCTIVDSHLIWRAGRFFRKEMFSYNKELTFVGNKKDVFGFPYVGNFLNNTTKTLSEEIPEAKYYILLLGLHEDKTEFINNYENLYQKINATNPNAKIFWITLPHKKETDKNSNKINDFITSNKKNNMEVIDFSSIIDENDYNGMSKDGIHFGKKTYRKLAKYLAGKIEKDEK